MIKIIGVSMIMSGFVTIGILAKNKLVVRVRILSEMIFLIEIMQRELKFNYIKTPKLIEKIYDASKTDLKKIFLKIQKASGYSIGHHWAKFFHIEGENIGLLKEDVEVIKNISKVLGKYDTYEQIQSLELFKVELEQNLKQAKTKFLKEGDLIKTATFMIGIAVIVILI